MLSIFTPTHDPQYLARLERSLAAQTYRGAWEWVIVPNGGATVRPAIPQARVVAYDGHTRNVGELKRFACHHSRGDVLVEVDHDDEVTEDCLERIAEAMADTCVDFAYSNTCEINADKSTRVYPEVTGWKTRPFTWRGMERKQLVAFDPTPASFSRIWYAPNHVRAWRRSLYEKIGGHNQTLSVLDDHDLLCRTYLAGNVRHIDQCLYVQHYHAGQTFIAGDNNAQIQTQTMALYGRYIERLALRWCRINHLRSIDLCGGHNSPAGYESVDLAGGKITANLNERWPFEPGSIGLIRAVDALEHLRDPLHTMREAYRVLAPGGWILSETPSTDGRGAFQDPTHISWWNENSFWYYTKANVAKYIGAPVRFQAVRVMTHFPSEWHQEHQIPYVSAHLMKPLARTPGVLEI